MLSQVTLLTSGAPLQSQSPSDPSTKHRAGFVCVFFLERERETEPNQTHDFLKLNIPRQNSAFRRRPRFQLEPCHQHRKLLLSQPKLISNQRFVSNGLL